MNRRIAIIVLLLIGGVVVNLAVAWGLALHFDFVRHGHYDGGNAYCDASGFWRTNVWYFPGGVFIESWRGPEPERGCEFDISLQADLEDSAYERSTHLYTPRIAGLHVDCGSRSRMVSARGWPFLALWCEYDLASYGSSGQVRVVGGFAIDELNQWRERLLPYMPVWRGFIINTLFYTLLLWLLFTAPFAARRMLRRRRGLCEKCAYPIGTWGGSPVCTECGADLTRLLRGRAGGRPPAIRSVESPGGRPR